MPTKEIEQKLINGEIVILEKKAKETQVKTTIEQIILTKEEFRKLISYQDNRSIMEDCFMLLDNLQIFSIGEYYRLIHGKKLVVDIFEEYSQFYIDAINDNIEQFGLEGE